MPQNATFHCAILAKLGCAQCALECQQKLPFLDGGGVSAEAMEGGMKFSPVANMVTDFKKGSQNRSTRFTVDCLVDAQKFSNCPNFERYFINFVNKYR